MLIAYLDEFGHQGPYISHAHKKYKTHPVFGYGGYILPADSVRRLGGYLEHIKESLLAYEIKQSGIHPRRWEKKGSALLTTKNYRLYGAEFQPALRRIFSKLEKLEGQLFFFGQEKPLGPVDITKETSQDREEHCLIQAITRLGTYASGKNEKILVIMDATDTDNRERAVATLGRTIYSPQNQDTKSVIEIPIQADSHLYGTLQLADWICAILGRLTDYHFAERSEFDWAIDLGRDTLPSGIFTRNSMIWGNAKEKSRCFPDKLFRTKKFWGREAEKRQNAERKADRNKAMRKQLLDAASPELQENLAKIRNSDQSN